MKLPFLQKDKWPGMKEPEERLIKTTEGTRMPKWPTKMKETEDGECELCGKKPCMCHGGKVNELDKLDEAYRKAKKFEHGGEVKQPVNQFNKFDGEYRKANHLDEGGEVEEMHEMGDESMDHELNEMVAEELLHAIEKKDKKGIVEAIQALVLSCKE